MLKVLHKDSKKQRINKYLQDLKPKENNSYLKDMII